MNKIQTIFQWRKSSIKSQQIIEFFQKYELFLGK